MWVSFFKKTKYLTITLLPAQFNVLFYTDINFVFCNKFIIIACHKSSSNKYTNYFMAKRYYNTIINKISTWDVGVIEKEIFVLCWMNGIDKIENYVWEIKVSYVIYIMDIGMALMFTYNERWTCGIWIEIELENFNHLRQGWMALSKA